ncbi:MAG: hypothetical protein PV340_02435 [Wolbachia sp.]|nr:hypothetical protein [Wolbachia sp.]MDD9335866.1 hypothetical protein [Wolbachia sp.]
MNPIFYIITASRALALLGALLYHGFEKIPDAEVNKIGEAKGVTPFVLPDSLSLCNSTS